VTQVLATYGSFLGVEERESGVFLNVEMEEARVEMREVDSSRSLATVVASLPVSF